MAITISDVANEAGVSKSTVSKVLNGWTTISDETIARVNAAIEKLNYIPNSRAVSFARQSTKNIVYLTNLGQSSAYYNPHMFDIMCGVHHQLAASNFTLTLVDTSEETYPGERALLEIKRRSTDGLIIHGSAVNQELADMLISESFPHIIIGHPEFNERLCWIDTNHALAGEFAADHMNSCDYRNVIFIAGKKTDSISNQRLKGFRRKMLNLGYHIPNENIIYTGATRRGAYEATLKFLDALRSSSNNVPDAIICENSELAVGTIQACRDLTIRIPDDLGFLCFDRFPYSTILDPAPSVIDIDMYDMGIQAGDMMIRKLNNPDLLIQSFTTLPLFIQGSSTVPKGKR